MLFRSRIANFINSELVGRVTTVPWAVIFPRIDDQPRHPAQIYQAFTEGLLLFLILMWIGRRRRPDGVLSGAFAICYAIVRIVTERYRAVTPLLKGDEGVWLGLTKGQFYSIGLIFLGIFLLSRAYRFSRHSRPAKSPPQ